jgi:hypothetical protein
MGHKNPRDSDSEVSDGEVEGILELQALQDSQQKDPVVDRVFIQHFAQCSDNVLFHSRPPWKVL